VRTTDSHHNLPIAPNLLDRNFMAPAPNRIWLADITYISTGEGWLYLAAVHGPVCTENLTWGFPSQGVKNH
jgi:transposase InsO family protein